MVPTRPTCHAERGRLKTERENARCQGCRGATRKAAKHARRRLRQALLSPGMGLRAHACAWSWTRREVGEDAVGQWGPRKHPTPTETRQGRSTAGLRAGTCQGTAKALKRVEPPLVGEG